MTTTTPDTVLIDTPDVTRRSSTRLRFAVAFLVGLIASMAIGAGALYAYDRQYAGRVLPGVAIGSLDLSGLDAVAAGAAIRQVYGYLGEGSLTFTTPDERADGHLRRDRPRTRRRRHGRRSPRRRTRRQRRRTDDRRRADGAARRGADADASPSMLTRSPSTAVISPIRLAREPQDAWVVGRRQGVRRRAGRRRPVGRPGGAGRGRPRRPR